MTPTEIYYNNLYIAAGGWMLWLSLIPVVAGVWYFRKLDKALKVFLGYLVAFFLFNALQQLFIWSVNHHTDFWLPYLEKFNIGDTNFLNIIGRLIDVAFLSWFYAVILPAKLSKWVRIAGWTLFFAAIGIYFRVDGYTSFGNVNDVINRVFKLVLPVLYLQALHKNPPPAGIWKNAYFVISIGLLIPDVFSLFMSLTGDKINETDFVLYVKVNLVRNALLLVEFIFFACAFRQARYTKYLSLPV